MKIASLLLALSYHLILINPIQGQSNRETELKNNILFNSYVESEFDRISGKNSYEQKNVCGNDALIKNSISNKNPTLKERILENRAEFIHRIEYNLRLGIKNKDRIRVTILTNLLLSYPQNEKSSLVTVLKDILPFVNNLNPKNFHEYHFYNSLKKERHEKLKGKEDSIIDRGILWLYNEEKKLIKELEDSKQMIIYNVVRNIYPTMSEEILSYALNEHEHKGDKIINIDYLLLYKNKPSNIRDRLIKAISGSNHLRNKNLLQKFDDFQKQ